MAFTVHSQAAQKAVSERERGTWDPVTGEKIEEIPRKSEKNNDKNNDRNSEKNAEKSKEKELKSKLVVNTKKTKSGGGGSEGGKMSQTLPSPLPLSVSVSVSTPSSSSFSSPTPTGHSLSPSRQASPEMGQGREQGSEHPLKTKSRFSSSNNLKKEAGSPKNVLRSPGKNVTRVDFSVKEMTSGKRTY